MASGIMADLIRAKDWSRTPLGPIENWPLSLRMAVDLCLNNRFPIHLWWGPELIYLYNDAYIAVLGKRHPDALGRSGREVWAEAWHILGPQVESVMVRGESTWNETAFIILERNGVPEDSWFTWSYSPIRDEAARIVGMICIATEDTARVLAERKRDQWEELRQKQSADAQLKTEDALRESTTLLRGISDATSDVIFAKDLEGRLRFVNPATLALLGKPLEEVIGKTDVELLPDRKTAQVIMQNDRRIMESGIAEDIEESVPLADGTRRVWFSRKMPNRDATGKVVGLLGVSRDITDQKRAEEAQAKLAAIVESSEDAIIGKTLDGIIVTWNRSAERLFGYTAADAVGHPITMLIPPDLAHEEVDIQQRLTRAEPIEHFETVRVTRDGRMIDVSLTISPIRNSAGTIIGASKIVRDITARKQADEALARQAEELARSNVELERFASVASHDLQEPLRSIQTFAQLLERECGGSLPGDSAEYLCFITKGVKRMQVLIDDVLSYSRVTAQGGGFGPVDCREICDQTVEALRTLIESNHAEITVEPLPVVVGDRAQLGQMFQNLLVNAIKYRSTQTPCIHVSAKETSSEWFFAIADNGIGIAPQYFERIFVIFQRLHAIDEYSGTGIGLAVCKKIAERHGGRIWLDSVVGEGSTFHFSILKRERHYGR